jgi:protein-disulfide isomerase
MDKRFWAIIGVIIVIFAGIVWLNGSKDDGSSATNASPTSHIKGNAESKVKLVEYGDFQCSVCASFYPAVEQTVEKYKDQISFQFVNYPIVSIHQNALSASRAAEAASNQDKFWEMYNLLFQNQQSWAPSNSVSSLFESYASQLGLDVAKFKTDYASSETNARINADKDVFNKTGFRAATPTFTLNGEQIRPTNTVEDFSKFIDEELKKQGIEPPAEVPVPTDTTPQQ